VSLPSVPIIVAEADCLFLDNFLCLLTPLLKITIASWFSPLCSDPVNDSGLLGGFLLYCAKFYSLDCGSEVCGSDAVLIFENTMSFSVF